MSEKPCAFCGEAKTLKNSHVLPAFVFRWFKSDGGHIRHTDAPNKRVQDGPKLYWLCSDCEKIFERYETEFSKKLFHPWLSGTMQVPYSDWLIKFCTSVSWRILKYARDHNPEAKYSDEQLTLLDESEERWRLFLQGKVPHPARFEQHLLITDFVEETNIKDIPINFNRFMTRAITFDIVGSPRPVMTFGKLGRFIIFGMIQKGPNKWEGTKVNLKNGVVKPRDIVLRFGLLDLFREKAAISENAMAKTSPKQLDKIDAYVLANLDKFRASDQFKAILADMEMFGPDAVIRKPTKEE